MTIKKLLSVSVLWGLMLALSGSMLAGCVVVPEGYYDRDHHRYYHDRHWHACVDRDYRCR
jgi:hypothetical protein